MYITTDGRPVAKRSMCLEGNYHGSAALDCFKPKPKRPSFALELYLDPRGTFQRVHS
ncbi:unnamed protein product [Periconia digitata]|uniref:Uncharacterized protein n=1 Tax=Periconia digitata TaxID=1303443 RepID=A0A9W4U8Z9_9PLEO|nr:unnamed protein product [Periconia digitata]